jgi:ribosomal protein S18 acetylase RimI-like enzyme
MDFNIKHVEDGKELRLLRKFLLEQPQFYPDYREWVDGKCIARIEDGEYKNIIVLSEGLVVGDVVYRYLNDHQIEVKNFRIDPEYRRRDLGHFLLKQVEFENPEKTSTLDVTVDNFLGVQFFIRNGFNIIDKETLYKPDQFEYIMQKKPSQHKIQNNRQYQTAH